MRTQVIAAVGYARQLTASATVEDMLGCLHRAREMLELQQREQDDCQRWALPALPRALFCFQFPTVVRLGTQSRNSFRRSMTTRQTLIRES